MGREGRGGEVWRRKALRGGVGGGEKRRRVGRGGEWSVIKYEVLRRREWKGKGLEG